MTALFTPITIQGMTLKNRIAMPPMCMYSATKNGEATDWHRIHYPTRAVGGVSLIILEATGIEPRGRITEQDLGIWDDAQVSGLREIVKLVQGFGARIGIQLAHAGRKSETREQPVGPSPIPFDKESPTPKELSRDEIRGIVKAFGKSAHRAKEAGFDVIEIHAAHGYLLNEFFSPLANQREDEYGGTIENRVRLTLEVIEEVRKYWSGPLFVRISAEEYAEQGNHLSEALAFSRYLKQAGVDLIDVSSGGVVDVPIEDYPGYQVKFSEAIRREVGIPTSAVGLIQEPQQALAIIEKGQADLVMMGRELLRHPYWPLEAARILGTEIPWPQQYERAKLPTL